MKWLAFWKRQPMKDETDLFELQGVGKPQNHQSLNNMIKPLHLSLSLSTSHNILFLFESKKNSDDKVFKNLMHIGLLTNMHSVSCSTNKSGGLTFLWCNYVNVTILNSSNNMIDINVVDSTYNNHGHVWRGISLYGYPHFNKKILTCNMIINLAQRHNFNNWLMFGDFNLITKATEKNGGNPIDFNLTNTINEAFNICRLYDIGYSRTMDT